jgi:acyl-CoA hydrolase
MEVGVEVYAEDPMSGKRLHTSSAMLTYVALDDTGQPTPVPPLRAENAEEMQRYQEGEKRYQKRKQRRPGSKQKD